MHSGIRTKCGFNRFMTKTKEDDRQESGMVAAGAVNFDTDKSFMSGAPIEIFIITSCAAASRVHICINKTCMPCVSKLTSC